MCLMLMRVDHGPQRLIGVAVRKEGGYSKRRMSWSAKAALTARGLTRAVGHGLSSAAQLLGALKVRHRSPLANMAKGRWMHDLLEAGAMQPLSAARRVDSLFIEIRADDFPGATCGVGLQGELYEDIHLGLARLRRMLPRT